MPQVLTATRAALDMVAADKMGDLPEMSSAELCALGAHTYPVIDTPALTWWDSQDDQERLAQMARAALARRQLLDPGTGRLAPPLSLILEGRARPSFILLTREKPHAQPSAERLYGIADESGTHAVLVESSQPNPGAWNGPAHHYRLNDIQPQATALAEWAAGRKRRTIDLYLPGSAGTLRTERLVVTPARNHQVSLARHSSSTVMTYDHKNLVRLIAGIMRGIP